LLRGHEHDVENLKPSQRHFLARQQVRFEHVFDGCGELQAWLSACLQHRAWLALGVLGVAAVSFLLIPG